jgi:hypothetical protein
MARPRDKDVVALAKAVNTMFNLGMTNVNAQEIADFHFKVPLANDFYELVRRRLGRIRDILAEDYEREVILLSDTFFRRFRSNPPINDEMARTCIPMGNGNRAEGLRLQTDYDDLIWKASIEANMATGSGKLKNTSNRVVAAVENGKLGNPDAAHILQHAQERSQPDTPLAAQQIMGFLDPGEKTEEEVPGLPE